MRLMVTDATPMKIRREPDRPLIAIGDVHGFSDALEGLMAFTHDYIGRTYPEREVDVVYLGDFIDRGPDPRGTMELVRGGLGLDLVSETALMGNHDSFLATAAGLGGRGEDLTNWATWMANGGKGTLEALGLPNPLNAGAQKIRDALGEDLCAFVGNLRLSFRSGDIFCVHAGVDPSRALDDQIEHDLIWIREPFLSLATDDEAPWTIGVTVVHGHTPPAFGAFANRICVDSGGYSTGIFSAVEIWDGAYRFFHLERSTD